MRTTARLGTMFAAQVALVLAFLVAGGFVGPASTAAGSETRSLSPASFTDVAPGDPYYEAIQALADAGIIDGYDDGTFRPGNDVWRAQYAKMIDGALGLWVMEGDTSPFTDLGTNDPDSLYPHEFVAAAYAQDIIRGLSATRFSPFTNIGRAQAVSMVVRAFDKLHPDALEPPPPGYVNTWGSAFSADHGPAARLAEYNGLLDGLPLAAGASNPWGPMPRGEVAQILWDAMQAPVITVSGTVTNESAVPLEHVTVRLVTFGYGQPGSAGTDAAGHYEIQVKLGDFSDVGRDADQKITLWAATTNDQGYVDVYHPDTPVLFVRPWDTTGFEDAGALGTITADFVLEHGFELRGQVRDASGPLAGIPVEASASARVSGVMGTTAADGKYVITGLPEADYTVKAHVPTGTGSRYVFYSGNQVSVTGDTTGIDILVTP